MTMKRRFLQCYLLQHCFYTYFLLVQMPSSFGLPISRNSERFFRFASSHDVPPSTLVSAEEKLTASNLSGVDMNAIANLQKQMKKRIQDLDSFDHTIDKGLANVADHATLTSLKGLQLNNEIIDPKSVEKDLEEFERQIRENNKKRNLTASVVEMLIGQLSPPILILEPSDIDPLESHFMMKLITCKEFPSAVA